jgi:hypothetical protein
MGFRLFLDPFLTPKTLASSAAAAADPEQSWSSIAPLLHKRRVPPKACAVARFSRGQARGGYGLPVGPNPAALATG